MTSKVDSFERQVASLREILTNNSISPLARKLLNEALVMLEADLAKAKVADRGSDE